MRPADAPPAQQVHRHQRPPGTLIADHRYKYHKVVSIRPELHRGPTIYEEWRPVADLCQSSLRKTSTSSAYLTAEQHSPTCPDLGTLDNPTYQLLAQLPANADDLLAAIRAHIGPDNVDPDGATFTLWPQHNTTEDTQLIFNPSNYALMGVRRGDSTPSPTFAIAITSTAIVDTIGQRP